MNRPLLWSSHSGISAEGSYCVAVSQVSLLRALIVAVTHVSPLWSWTPHRCLWRASRTRGSPELQYWSRAWAGGLEPWAGPPPGDLDRRRRATGTPSPHMVINTLEVGVGVYHVYFYLLVLLPSWNSCCIVCLSVCSLNVAT